MINQTMDKSIEQLLLKITELHFVQGCYDALVDFILDHINILIAVGASVGAVEVQYRTKSSKVACIFQTKTSIYLYAHLKIRWITHTDAHLGIMLSLRQNTILTQVSKEIPDNTNEPTSNTNKE